MIKGYIILKEAFPDRFDPDFIVACFFCTLFSSNFNIRYSIYCVILGKEKINGRI